jgi:hypothetical protein
MIKLVIASGKGGTGKTTVAVNLALALKEKNIQLLDCDVEEPNAHLFLKPQLVFQFQRSICRSAHSAVAALKFVLLMPWLFFRTRLWFWLNFVMAVAVVLTFARRKRSVK